MQHNQPHTIALAERIQFVFPSMEWRRALAIARHYHDRERAVRPVAHVHAGTEWIECLVAAHVRHTETDYETRFPSGFHAPLLKQSARSSVQEQVNNFLKQWKEIPL